MLLLTDPPDLPPLPTRRSSDLGPNPSTDSYVIKGIAKLKNITALRVDALPHKSFPAGGQRLVRQRVHAQRRDVLQLRDALDHVGIGGGIGAEIGRASCREGG